MGRGNGNAVLESVLRRILRGYHNCVGNSMALNLHIQAGGRGSPKKKTTEFSTRLESEFAREWTSKRIHPYHTRVRLSGERKGIVPKLPCYAREADSYSFAKARTFTRQGTREGRLASPCLFCLLFAIQLCMDAANHGEFSITHRINVALCTTHARACVRTLNPFLMKLPALVLAVPDHEHMTTYHEMRYHHPDRKQMRGAWCKWDTA